MRRLLVLVILVSVSMPASAQQARRALDHDVYDSWNAIEDERLSDDGRWILYALVPQEGDAVLHVRSTRAQTAYSVSRGRSARFTDDARFQYERTQSRIGGSLWEARAKYIQNSPLFWADRVATPVLMMHNDDDGAVPWYQGIEFFVALRRLNKPVWMLNYNGEPHGLRKYQNRKDWQVRMQQFFDHYLNDAPAPVWLAEGVPAVEKGKTLGLELVEPEKAVTGSGR